jgi:type I restriction enzyme S subunit
MNRVKLTTIIASLESGGRPKGGANKDTGEIWSLGAEHLDNQGGFRFVNPKMIPRSFFDSLSKGIINQSDILIVKDGATTGKVSFVDSEFPFQKAAINEHLFLLRVNTNRAHPKYVYHYLRSVSGQREILKDFRGATVGGISRQFSDGVDIPLPPLPEQKRIAAILDKADEIRRKREKAIELTDAFLRSVFLEMFGDPVSNPRKWGTVAIREIAKVVTGNTPSRKISSYFGDEIDWIKSDNINTPSHFLTPASERLSLSGKAVGRVVPRNSILITCIAGSPACIGNAAISTREVAFNQQINALVPFSDNCEFIYSLILLGKKLIQSASTNSMKGMVSKGKLEQIKVINPPDSLQHRFREVFLAHCKHRETLECQLLKIMECQNSLVAHLLYPNNEGLAQRGTASTYETAHAL